MNAAKSRPVAGKAASIDAAQARPLTWKTAVKRALALAVAGAAIYLVLPKLIAVLGAWPRLSTLNQVWFTVCLAAELVSFTCNFALQRLALRTKGWFPVVTAGLTGNAVTNSLPGGDAAGAAVQFHMLTTAGFDTDTAVGGLTAFSLLEVGGLLALPIVALPAILAGVPVSRGLVHTALLGIVAFVLYAVFGVIVLRADWPLATVGRAAQRLWNRVTRGQRQPVSGLDQRLLAERDTIKAVLGNNGRQAVVLTVGRLGFDYGCLLAALRATGAEPQPSLVLLAYAAAGIIALFPLTPGGLGIVEASLSGLLILAGVRVAVGRAANCVSVDPERGVVEESAAVHLCHVDLPLDAVCERVESTGHVVPVHTHVEREMVARAGRNAHKWNAVRGRHRGHHRQRPVATGHPKRVSAGRHCFTGQRVQVLSGGEDDNLDPLRARTLGDPGVCGLAATGPRVDEQRRPTRRVGGLPAIT